MERCVEFHLLRWNQKPIVVNANEEAWGIMERHLIALHLLLSRLENAGYKVAFLDDPEEISDIVLEIGKPYVTDILSPSLNDFSRHTARWMVLYNDDSPALAGGFRVEDLGDESVASFWAKVFRRHYGNGQAAIGDVSPILKSRLRGKLAYFGDMYVAEEFRDTSPVVKRTYADIAHLFVHGIWKPDWHYSFIRQRDLGRGAMSIYGYTMYTERPMKWLIDPPAPRSRGEVCVYVSEAEIADRVDDLAAKYQYES